MPGPADLANLALQMLGANYIVNLDDAGTNAEEMNLAYLPTLYAELRRHRWKFSIRRINLPALAAAPVNGVYGTAFQLPPDNLRVLNVGDYDPGQDISDYRFRTVAEFSIENNQILTNYAAPLSLRYITNAVSEGQFDPCFSDMFVARLAWRTCEKITQSVEKRKLAMSEYKIALKEAISSGALESPPQFADSDSWVSARVAGV